MQKRKVLVVDDEGDFCYLIKSNLEETGEFEVMAVTNSKEALAAALFFKPDVVLLDVLMPEVDGGEVAYQLHSQPELKETPIIFLTAAVTKKEVNTSCDGYIGGHPFIAKPVSTDQLIKCIKEHGIKQ